MKRVPSLLKYILFSQRLSPVTGISRLDHFKYFSQTHIRNGFFEKDKRGAEYPVYPSDKPWNEHIRDGRKIFFEECKLFWEEVKEHLRNDPKLYVDGDTEVIFRFDSKDCLNKWRVGSDKIYKEGFSDCSFIVNDRGKGVFHGNVDTTPPKDGKARFTGFCGIKSVRKTKSFLRDDWYDWSGFTHIEVRVKGDGRNYMINIGLGMYYDVSWFDTYTYVLHTHGGPYWQVIRIPFSKFFLTAKGRIQDNQQALPLSRVSTIGITCAAVSGPFHLEIDYIAVSMDLSHEEKTAYELYKIPKEYVSV